MDNTQELLKTSINYFGGAEIPIKRPQPWSVVIEFFNSDHIDFIKSRFESNFVEPMVVVQNTYLIGKCESQEHAYAVSRHLNSIIERASDSYLKSPFHPGWLSEYKANDRCGISAVHHVAATSELNEYLEYKMSKSKTLNQVRSMDPASYEALLSYSTASMVDAWLHFLQKKYPKLVLRNGVKAFFEEILDIVIEASTSEYFVLPEFLIGDAQLICDKLIAHNPSIRVVENAERERDLVSRHLNGRNSHLSALFIRPESIDRIRSLSATFSALMSRIYNDEDSGVLGLSELEPYQHAMALKSFSTLEIPMLNKDESIDPMTQGLVSNFIKTAYLWTMANNTQRVSNFIHLWASSMDSHSCMGGFTLKLEECFQSDQEA